MSPKVSIGLPVYNGENYIAQAIESALAQTFDDFELLISDNASTDRTQEICQHYAGRDARIRYIRHSVNRGATWNFNHVCEMASGMYFNWLAHDDLLAPDFLEKCVSFLDTQSDTVLCFSNVLIIDQNSHPLEQFNIQLRTGSHRPSLRFYDLLMVWHDCLPIFGLIRASSLKKTPLIGPYTSGDHVLLARLGLMGKFHIIPENLFLSRRHSLQSNKLYNVWIDHHAYSRWFDSSKQGKLYLPQWEIFFDHFRMIGQAHLSLPDMFLCSLVVGRWAARYRKLLWKDWVITFQNLLQPRKTAQHDEKQKNLDHSPLNSSREGEV